ncbi:hypothetical protein VHEMI01963 [[Torrubiella] hemipterigena]|uniref:Phosphoglycerate mutase family protein n=1 Tax=[Torrubiella] hemipterigena TaxID=1531966 RepID=A0A0A1T6T0_9HYPO|nr:hypothetical protein VHEMI01963 [[Torrubiella] hemipterigena]
MKLLLIRHGETVDNVASIWAGVRDSALTSHGALQASHLGAALSARSPPLSPAHVFSSDLQRAAKTAQACVSSFDPQPPHTKLVVLRERDFGPLEGKSFRGEGATTDAEAVAEPREAMRARADAFITEHLIPALKTHAKDGTCILVVSHGIMLATLFTALTMRAPRGGVTYTPSALSTEGFVPGVLPWWGNTAYLECEVRVEEGDKLRLEVDKINEMGHLANVRKAGGGIGNATYDEKQTKMDMFLKKA